MASHSAEVTAGRLRDGGEVKGVTLLRGDDLLFAEVGASEAADAFCAPGLGANPIQGIGPIRHVSLIHAELTFRLELAADILHDHDIAVRREIVSRTGATRLAIRRPHENRRKWSGDIARAI